MTKVESIMLAVCFGAVMGDLFYNISQLIKCRREIRKIEKKLEDVNHESN